MECLLCTWVYLLQVVGFYYKQLMLLPMLAFAAWPWLTRREQLDQVKHQHRLTLASYNDTYRVQYSSIIYLQDGGYTYSRLGSILSMTRLCIQFL